MTGGSSGDGVRSLQDDPPNGGHGLRCPGGEDIFPGNQRFVIPPYFRRTPVGAPAPILSPLTKTGKAAPRFAERRIFRKFIRDQNEKTCNPSGCRFLYFCENGPGVTAKAAAIDQHGRDMPPAPSRRVPHITGLFPQKPAGVPASCSKNFLKKPEKS